MMHKANYSTNLTEKQLQVIEKLLENKTRKRKYSIAEIINAIYYLLKTGCQWRMLPLNFPKWQLVYYYYNKWKNEGAFEQTSLDELCSIVFQSRFFEHGKKLCVIDILELD